LVRFDFWTGDPPDHREFIDFVGKHSLVSLTATSLGMEMGYHWYVARFFLSHRLVLWKSELVCQRSTVDVCILGYLVIRNGAHIPSTDGHEGCACDDGGPHNVVRLYSSGGTRVDFALAGMGVQSALTTT
jgi:hypothetical protein